MKEVKTNLFLTITCILLGLGQCAYSQTKSLKVVDYNTPDQDVQYMIFNHTGEMVSSPVVINLDPKQHYFPENIRFKSFKKLYPDKLHVMVQVKDTYMKERVQQVLDHYIQAYQSLKTAKYDGLLIDSVTVNQLSCEYYTRINDLLKGYEEFIDTEDYYKDILEVYSRGSCDGVSIGDNVPKPTAIIPLKYNFYMNIYDSNGKMMTQECEVSMSRDTTIRAIDAPPCPPGYTRYKTAPKAIDSLIAINSLARKIEFKLVEQNNNAKQILDWQKNFPFDLLLKASAKQSKSKTDLLKKIDGTWKENTKSGGIWSMFSKRINGIGLFQDLITVSSITGSTMEINITSGKGSSCDGTKIMMNTANTNFIRNQEGYLVIEESNNGKFSGVIIKENSIECYKEKVIQTNGDKIPAIDVGTILNSPGYKDLKNKLNTLYSEDELLELRDWFLRGFWIQNKPLNNPFKQTPVDRESAKKRDRLTKSRDSLIILDKQIDLYEKLKLKTNCKNCSKKEIDASLAGLDRLLQERAKIRAKVQSDSTALARALGEEERSKSAAASFENDLLKNTLLYDGVLYTSGDNEINFMRHHNSLRHYNFMNRFIPEEITEEQKLILIAENLEPDAKLVIKSTTEAVTPATLLEEELIVPEESDDFELSTTLTPESFDKRINNTQSPLFKVVRVDSSDLLDYFRTSEILVFNKLLFTEGFPKLPLKITVDDTPNFFGRELDISHPQTGPLKVNYEITNEEKEDADFKSSYRVNKLFKVRFKTGILYSSFLREDISTDGINVTRSSERHGIDGTFGIQYYVKRHDIRSNKIPFILYGGLSMRRPTENFFLGAGIEPYSGLSLIGGLHISQSDRLQSEGGVFSVRQNQWGTNVFASINVDVEVFTQLFNLRTNSPFQLN